MTPAVRFRVALACSLASLFAISRTPADAYGPQGHAVIAEVAWHYLTPSTRSEIEQLLVAGKEYGIPECPVNTIEEAANFPDCLRQFDDKYKYTFPWHYDSASIYASKSDTRDWHKYCRKGQCLSGQYDRFVATLADKSAPVKERLKALEFVMHLTGDAHMPLHAASNNDSGGNMIPVTFYDNKDPKLNLHHVWDVELVSRVLDDRKDAADWLISQITPRQAKQWSRGNIHDWMAQSRQISRSLAYRKLPDPPAPNAIPTTPEVLGDDYYNAVKKTAQLQLERAGVRLAKVLNQALSSDSPPPKQALRTR